MSSIDDRWKEIRFTEDGGFHMPTKDMESFTEYLQQHGVRCGPPELDAIGGGHSIGHVLPPIDVTKVNRLHREWIMDQRRQGANKADGS